MKTGVDVSFHRGYPDWSRAKGNVDFAILAVTDRVEGIDKTFEHNYAGCVANGIPVGVYSYSYATDGDDSARYARMVVDAIAGKKIDLPVFLDMEWEEQERFPQSRINSIILRFKEVIEEAGYTFGLYCNKDWYYRLIPDFVKDGPIWIGWPATTGNTCPENLRPDIKSLVAWQYSWTGSVPGIDGETDMDIWYGAEGQNKITAEDALRMMRTLIGRRQADGTHKYIIDTYNNHEPLAQGYRLNYGDSWCDATISAVFILLDAVYLIGGTECGVERHVDLFKRAGIWEEDGSIIPEPGDIIVFDWEGTDGFSDHIGMVEYVEGSIIHTIEGNAGGEVKRRAYHVGESVIRGYAKPKYAPEVSESPEKPLADTGEGTLAPTLDKPAKSPYDRPQLAINSRGEDVRDVQKALNTLWGRDLDEDGIFGIMTQRAVCYCQDDMGIEVDGIVGPQTWRGIINRLMARIVLTWAYGNGAEYKERLTKEGYDYQSIQAEVNRLLS